MSRVFFVSMGAFMIAAAGGGVWALKRYESTRPKAVALQAFDCFERRDAECLLQLRSPRDNVEGLSEEQVKRGIREIVFKRFEGFAPSGSVEWEKDEGDNRVFGSMWYRHSDGRKAAVSFGVAETEEGTRAESLLWTMFVSAADTGPESEKALSFSGMKNEAEKIGIHRVKAGMYETSEMLTWNQIERR